MNPIDSENYPLLAWGTLMQLFPKVLIGEAANDWLSFESLKGIRDRTDLPDYLEMESKPQRTIQLAQSQAGGLLKCVCTDFAELVYRFDGVSRCEALTSPATTPPVSPPPVIPAGQPKPGDDKPRPGFDPLLD